jgi:hypothetical protein
VNLCNRNRNRNRTRSTELTVQSFSQIELLGFPSSAAPNQTRDHIMPGNLSYGAIRDSNRSQPGDSLEQGIVPYESVDRNRPSMISIGSGTALNRRFLVVVWHSIWLRVVPRPYSMDTSALKRSDLISTSLSQMNR